MIKIMVTVEKDGEFISSDVIIDNDIENLDAQLRQVLETARRNLIGEDLDVDPSAKRYSIFARHPWKGRS